MIALGKKKAADSEAARREAEARRQAEEKAKAEEAARAEAARKQAEAAQKAEMAKRQEEAAKAFKSYLELCQSPQILSVDELRTLQAAFDEIHARLESGRALLDAGDKAKAMTVAFWMTL